MSSERRLRCYSSIAEDDNDYAWGGDKPSRGYAYPGETVILYRENAEGREEISRYTVTESDLLWKCPDIENCYYVAVRLDILAIDD